MSMPFWSHWCRLCASDSKELKVDLNSLGQDMLYALDKYFDVKICWDDTLSTKLCSFCNVLLNELVDFSNRVSKAKAMFEAVRYFDVDETIDVRDLRQQWGLEECNLSMEYDANATYAVQENSLNRKCSQRPIQTMWARNNENEFELPSASIDETDYLVEEPVTSSIAQTTCRKQKNNKGAAKRKQLRGYSVRTEQGDFLVTIKDEPSSPVSVLASEDSACSYNSKESIALGTSSRRDNHNSLMCHLCGKSYQKGTYYNLHLTQCTGNTRIHKAATCEICKKTMSCQKNLKQHILHVHQTMKPYICQICGKGFKVRKGLKDHQISHTEDRPHLCSICNKGFKNLVQLKKHGQSHGEPQFKCDTCGKKLQTRARLRIHKLIHNEPRYKCDYCGKRTVSSDTLKNHLLSHVGIKPYVCKYCKKAFTSRTVCCKHTLKAHPREYAQDPDKQFLRSVQVPHINELRSMVRAMADALE